MKIKAIFFDIDDTLYDSSQQAKRARKNAIKSMIEAGLDISEDEGVQAINRIVVRLGSNYEYHFDELVKEFGYEGNPRIIAAGIVAYHRTKTTYLVPLHDTIPTLLELKSKGHKIGIITDGRAVKQWEKIIQLGLQHFFDVVVISEQIGKEKPDKEMFENAVKEIGCMAGEAVMVGDRVDKDIAGANAAGMTTVRLLNGKYAGKKPENKLEEPDYVIHCLGEILRILPGI